MLYPKLIKCQLCSLKKCCNFWLFKKMYYLFSSHSQLISFLNLALFKNVCGAPGFVDESHVNKCPLPLADSFVTHSCYIPNSWKATSSGWTMVLSSWGCISDWLFSSSACIWLLSSSGCSSGCIWLAVTENCFQPKLTVTTTACEAGRWHLTCPTVLERSILGRRINHRQNPTCGLPHAIHQSGLNRQTVYIQTWTICLSLWSPLRQPGDIYPQMMWEVTHQNRVCIKTIITKRRHIHKS